MSDTIQGLGTNALADLDLYGITRSDWSGPFYPTANKAIYSLNSSDARYGATITITRNQFVDPKTKKNRISVSINCENSTTHDPGDGTTVLSTAKSFIGFEQDDVVDFYSVSGLMSLITNAFSVLLSGSDTGAPAEANLTKLLSSSLPTFGS